MITIYLEELKMKAGSLGVWLGVLLAANLVARALYPLVLSGGEILEAIVSRLPAILRTLTATAGADIGSGSGFYLILAGWFALPVAAYALHAGAMTAAGEELTGAGEFLFTRPIRREQVLGAKILSALTHLAALALISNVLNRMLLGKFLGEEGPQVLGRIGMGIFLTMALFYSLGLLLAALIRDPRLGLTTAMLILPLTLLAALFHALGIVPGWMNLFGRYPAVETAARGISGASLLSTLLFLGIAGFISFVAFRFRDIVS